MADRPASIKALQRQLRDAAAERQRWRCWWCRQPMFPAIEGDEAMPQTCTADHIVPHGEGGRTDPENVVAACYACNQRRGREYDQGERPTTTNIASKDRRQIRHYRRTSTSRLVKRQGFKRKKELIGVDDEDA